MDRWLRKWLLRLRAIFRPTQVERELDEELRFHLDARTTQGVERGLPIDEARRRAVLSLEGLEQQKEACRDTRGWRWLDHLRRDVRHGVRALRRQPGFTLAAILSLALGIGANSAIFQVIDAVRLRALPVPRPQELAEVRIAGGQGGFGISSGFDVQATYPLWEELRDHQRVFSHVFAWGTNLTSIGRGGEARIARVLWLTGDAFATLEVVPVAGRLIDDHDESPACRASVVLSHAFWQSDFNGDPTAVGGSLYIMDRALPIVGVTAKDFFGLEVGRRFDVALPACAVAQWGNRIERRDYFWLNVIGRLRPGVSVDRAGSELGPQSVGLFEATTPDGYSAESTARYRNFRFTAVPASTGASELRRQYGDALWVLLAMTGLVLVLACTNIMNLQLARATSREHEVALRLAIGASRQRVFAQMLVESVLLAGAGAATGLIIAERLSRMLVGLLSTEFDPLYLDLQPHWTVFAFTLAIGAGACLLFGLAPALRASNAKPGAALKDSGRGLSTSRERLLTQRALIVLQVIVSLVLIFGATLFVRSFDKLTHADLGITPTNLIVARLWDTSPPSQPDQAAVRHDELLAAIRRLPGVQAAATTTKVPLDGTSWTLALMPVGVPSPKRSSSKFTYVSPDYFRTVGMRLVAGRDLADTDRRSSAPVLVVNQTFVRRILAGTDPIGSHVRTIGEPGYPPTDYEVVGVVNDATYQGVRDVPRPIAYAAFVQNPKLGSSWPTLLVRPSETPAPVIAALKQVLVDGRPTMTLGITLLEGDIRNGLLRERVMSWLAGAFGVVAALLAFIGIYGVISYVVERRRHELAIRLSLGSGRARVVRLIAGQLAVLIGIGLALGMGTALLLGRAAGTLLFALSAHDSWSIATSLALLIAVAVFACTIPALRAARLDVTQALKTE
ncbi:MAG TPA: ABC transporter permease [Vicinamibacterales bacterium]|nr:ABC transporter permease [Vicinamibacterales bacterium]